LPSGIDLVGRTKRVVEDIALADNELGLDLNELVEEPKDQNESDIVHEISNEPKTETLTTLSETGLL